MGHLKTRGIILKELNTGEADKIVTIFSRDAGRLTAVARSAKRPKSKLSAGTQFICYSDFVLFKGKNMYILDSCELLEPFYEIRNDIVKLTYSAHFVDIVNDVIQENQPDKRVLELLLNSLHMLAKTDRLPELIKCIFELRLLSIAGYAPFVQGCAICGKEEEDDVLFSFKKCGFICGSGECMENDRNAMKIEPGTAKAIRHIVCSEKEKLFNFNVSSKVLEELVIISSKYLREQLEHDYNKLDFLKHTNL